MQVNTSDTFTTLFHSMFPSFLFLVCHSEFWLSSLAFLLCLLVLSLSSKKKSYTHEEDIAISCLVCETHNFTLTLWAHFNIIFFTGKTMIIYHLSAFAGSLLSALFVQHSPVVGASSPLFGLLGATFSGLIQKWSRYDDKVIDLSLK